MFTLTVTPCVPKSAPEFTTVTLEASPGNSFTHFLLWNNRDDVWIQSEKGTAIKSTVQLEGFMEFNAVMNSTPEPKTVASAQLPCNPGQYTLHARVVKDSISEYYVTYTDYYIPSFMSNGEKICMCVTLAFSVLILFMTFYLAYREHRDEIAAKLRSTASPGPVASLPVSQLTRSVLPQQNTKYQSIQEEEEHHVG